MAHKTLFTEEEKLAGYVTVHSGSLIITDSVWDTSHIHKEDKLNIDLEEDISLKIPVTTIRQNGKRYILIAIDSGIPSIANSDKKIEVEEPIDIDAKE